MIASMVLSKSSAKVVSAFLDDPTQEQYGFGLMRSAGVGSGTLYPLLDRLEQIGWIEGRDELIDEEAEGRPKRRLYRLTGLGQREGMRAVTNFYRDLGPAPRWLPRLDEGM